MEYLVTMTTHVPAGTPEETVEQIRAREAARSRELAGQHHLLRLWRPPLQPGEWRTLGLFAASGDDQLEEVLASMPLRVWRSDEVTPLQPHPNDPGSRPAREPPSSSPPSRSRSRRAPRAGPLTTRRRPRRTGPRNWPGRDTCSGCGSCPAPGGRWACGGPRTWPRCGRSSRHCRLIPG